MERVARLRRSRGTTAVASAGARLGPLACTVLLVMGVASPRVARSCEIFELDPPAGPVADGVVGFSKYVQLSAEIDGYVYWTTSGSLPPGLSLVSVYGVPYASIEGTPTVAGNYAFCATVTCEATTPSWTNCYTMEVRASCAPPLVLGPPALPTGAVGTPYYATLTASGGTAPYAFFLTDGLLPYGLSLSSTGDLLGTPSYRGGFTFEVEAVDATGCASLRRYAIDICIVDFAPSSLPDAVLSVPYGVSFAGTQGVPPFRYGIAAGALPPGLRLSSWGTLDGTPASAGTYTFSVRATDATGCTRTRDLGIDVHSIAAGFSAVPRIVRPGDLVLFKDESVGAIQSRSWSFGDGGTSALQDPSHAYATTGYENVALIVAGGGETSTETKPAYILVSTAPPVAFVTGPGPDPSAPPRVLGHDALGAASGVTTIDAYGALGYGANVGAGDIDGIAPAEILTGPGPSAALGPQVRAFKPSSVPVAKVSFYAYGTLRYGVNVAGVELDADPPAEIVTTPGPGAPFGPHARGFDFDGVALTAMPGVNAYAFATLRYGANSGKGDIDGGAGEEVLTAPGPGPTFSANVRAFRYGPPLAAIGRINFVAFAGAHYGARVAGSDVDGDGTSEIAVGRGPEPSSATVTINVFDYDGQTVTPLPSAAFAPFGAGAYGIVVHGGDLDGDLPREELLAARGPDPAAAAEVRGFAYATTITPLGLDVTPYPFGYGVNVATGYLGF